MGAPVDSIAGIETITLEVITTNAVISFWLINAFGIGVTCIFTSLAFINGTDQRVVITGKPQGPLSSVCWSALSVNVIGQGLNTIEKIFSGFNVVKVEKMTWNGNGFWITLGAITLSRRSWVVSQCYLEFFVE